MSAPIVERPHGYNRYKTDRCRCFTCRVDHSRYLREYRAGLGVMRVDYVPIGPVVEHIRRLSSNGVGYRRLSELSGVHNRTIRRWKYGEVDVALKSLVDKVLAVEVDAAAPRWLDATGTQRRIKALGALGWPVTEMADRVGWRVSNFMQLLRRNGVQRSTAGKVYALYDDLSMTVPADSYATSRARLRARRDLWFPPLSWDDEVIDDPEGIPCILPPREPVHRDVELAVQHLAAGHVIDVTTEARVEFVRRTRNWRAVTVAEHALCDARTIFKIRKALDR